MEHEISTIKFVAFNNGLLSCLKTKDNHKFSRYDAFIWIVENIRSGKVQFNSKGLRSVISEYQASYTKLCDIWHWSRPTVQKFCEELQELEIIDKRKNGNAFVFTLTDEFKDKVVF